MTSKILQDDNNEQASTQNRECHSDLIRCTPYRWETRQHIVRAPSPASRTITFHEVPTRSKAGPCTRDEVLVPSNSSARPSSWLPHPPSIKPPWSREVWFDKLVTKILSLSDPIKARHAVSTILNLLTEAKMP
jgi:hypothetical protein